MALVGSSTLLTVSLRSLEWARFNAYAMRATGTAVHVAASFTNSTDFPVRIDNEDFLLYTGNGTYDSPTLPDGQHTITYGMGNLSVFPALDYLTVTAGPKTMLYGKTIAVDDTDRSVTFRGNWAQSSQYPPSTSFDYSSRLYQSTSHWTSNVGDTMEFTFEGNVICYVLRIPCSLPY